MTVPPAILMYNLENKKSAGMYEDSILHYSVT
jgi:hypothetical protein